ncbi:MAG: winged helix-turn-helix transcriptional regulator [Candidatus Heimdallarchaeota archaeon]|nr:MAG: winged helix-turn-helix transcriptional regulator [Candidatus Heimdallarchaeota archaeon]
MFYEKPEDVDESLDIPPKKVITDPSVVPVLFHKKKQKILNLLLEKEFNIMELKQETNLNPGTIKRYLDDLVSKDLAFLTRKVQNEYGFFLKYYRATAKSFIIHIKWPSEV